MSDFPVDEIFMRMQTEKETFWVLTPKSVRAHNISGDTVIVRIDEIVRVLRAKADPG